MDTEHPLDKAARIVGSQVELARRLGVSKGALNQWKDEGRQVPGRHCPSIERETRACGEVVLCEELNTEIDWAYVRANPAALAALDTADSAQEA